MTENPARRKLHHLGGWSLVIMAITHIVDFPLFYIAGGALGPEGGLKTIAENRVLFQIHGVLLLGFLLLIPGILSIYQALKKINPTRMVAGTAAGLVSAIQIAWIVPFVLSELVLSAGYVKADNEALRNAYIVSAAFVRGALSASYLVRMSLLFLHMFLVGPVMREANWGRKTATLSTLGGMIGIFGVSVAILFLGPFIQETVAALYLPTGILPLVGSAGFALVIMLPPIWALASGYQLLKLGKRQPSSL